MLKNEIKKGKVKIFKTDGCLYFFFLKIYLLIFREGGGEAKGEAEKLSSRFHLECRALYAGLKPRTLKT